jgi:hypothetical protein
MPLSIFTYFRKAYFLLHFLSPFLVLRLTASSFVFYSINFLIVCVFSCFCLSLFYLSIPPVYVFRPSPGIFCFFMLSDVCIGPRRCVPTFISRNCNKPQHVRFWSPLYIAPVRHFQLQALQTSRWSQSAAEHIRICPSWRMRRNISNSPVVNKYTVTPYVVRAVSVGHLISQCQLIPFEQSVPQHTYHFSNRNHRSNCSAVPSHMHIYFEWVNTKYFMFNPLKAELNPICPLLALFGAHHILHISRIRVKLKLTFFSLLKEKNTDWRRFKLGADTGISA